MSDPAAWSATTHTLDDMNSAVGVDIWGSWSDEHVEEIYRQHSLSLRSVDTVVADAGQNVAAVARSSIDLSSRLYCCSLL